MYFLVGPDPENSLRPLVYIGESDDVGTRLKHHNRPEAESGGAGGKDFWEKVCLVTSKDQNLTKAHVKYLESLLIQDCCDEVGRCLVVNGTAHEYISLPESDRADMAFFIEQIRTVLPVLGFDFLRETARPSRQPDTSTPSAAPKSPRFNFKMPRHDIKAVGEEIGGEFYVLEGSLTRGSWTGVDGGYQALYEQLCADEVLVDNGQGKRRFAADYGFSSPSAAAAVVAGRSANGRISWKLENSNQTYGDWQDEQVSAVAAPSNTLS